VRIQIYAHKKNGKKQLVNKGKKKDKKAKEKHSNTNRD
jgi:hypothetical protein